MKILCISDTFGKHEKLKLMKDGEFIKADILVHAGNITRHGDFQEAMRFINWLEELPYKVKMFIPGDMDSYFEKRGNHFVNSLISAKPENGHCIYLNDSGCTFDGINFWGSPVVPDLKNTAFNKLRGNDISQHWDKIPEDTDVLITHTPRFGMLDMVLENEDLGGEHLGCADLTVKIRKIRPQIHIFGHIREDYGEETLEHTRYVNASSSNFNGQIVNEPLIVEI